MNTAKRSAAAALSGITTTTPDTLGRRPEFERPEQETQMWHVLAEKTGITEMPALESALSRYGRSNQFEAVAEAWSDYVYSSDPRPVAKTIGDYLVSVLG